MVEQSILKTVHRYIENLNIQGIPVRLAVLFGSQATGKTHEFSDIDLLIISPLFDGDFPRNMINILWRIAAQTDSRIEPLPCGENQWKTDDKLPIIEIARREGIKIHFKPAA